jgi:hypothetical protein
MTDCPPNALGVFWFRGKNEKLRSRVRRFHAECRFDSLRTSPKLMSFAPDCLASPARLGRLPRIAHRAAPSPTTTKGAHTAGCALSSRIEGRTVAIEYLCGRPDRYDEIARPDRNRRTSAAELPLPASLNSTTETDCVPALPRSKLATREFDISVERNRVANRRHFARGFSAAYSNQKSNQSARRS